MAYALLNDSAKELYSIDNATSLITRTKHSKPQINGLVFSLSHSGGAVCVALCADKAPEIGDIVSRIVSDQNPHSIGVDVECISSLDVDKCKRVAKAKFLQSEQEVLSKYSSDLSFVTQFAKIWTAKESYGKFTGCGLVDALKFDTTDLNSDVQFYCDVITIEGKIYCVSVCFNAK